MTKHRGAKAGIKRIEQKEFWPGWLARLAANHNQTTSWPGWSKSVQNHNPAVRRG